jgi:hypothetical protein
MILHSRHWLPNMPLRCPLPLTIATAYVLETLKATLPTFIRKTCPRMCGVCTVLAFAMDSSISPRLCHAVRQHFRLSNGLCMVLGFHHGFCCAVLGAAPIGVWFLRCSVLKTTFLLKVVIYILPGKFPLLLS